jgi:hypothetical protein
MAENSTKYDTNCIPPGKKLIFRPWRIDPVTGERLWARSYGYKAWPILVDDDAA